MMTRAEKTRENRIRRKADRQHLTLRRSRIRDPLARDYGTYELRESWPPHRFMIANATIDRVEAWLESPRARARAAELAAGENHDGDGPVTAAPRIPGKTPDSGGGSEARVTEPGPEPWPGEAGDAGGVTKMRPEARPASPITRAAKWVHYMITTEKAR